MRRAGFGFLWLILGIVTLGVVGALAYNAGLTAGLAATATETAVAVVPAYGWGVGFGFGWIFFPVLFLFLLFGFFALIGGRRRGWGGRGWDPNGMAPDDLPPPIRRTLERWHADAHPAPGTPSSQGGSDHTPDA